MPPARAPYFHMTIQYKQTGHMGLFDKAENSAKLVLLGNPLKKLSAAVEFEIFRPLLEEHMLNRDRKNAAGCKPWDVVLLFKILILKRIYNLGDEGVEYQITDRLSFREFLGLESGDPSPDSRTIWSFQERLIEKRLDEALFARFDAHLRSLGAIIKEGSIIDASFVEVPRQRNTREQNEKIKAGEGAQLWADKPRKESQKDIDARWTKKGGQAYYGYKDHAKVDAKSKLITAYRVTPASVHDSQTLDALTDEADKGQELNADSAYVGEENEKILTGKGIIPRICERAYRGKPLTEEQKQSNRQKSKTRSRVEHTFGFITNSMNGFRIKCIGLERTRGVVGLINLTYNMFRIEQIIRLKLLALQPLQPAAA